MTEEKNKDIEYLEELEQEKKKRKRQMILFIIFIILIILIHIFFYLMGYRIGKIGYEEVSTEPMDIIKVTENDTNWENIEDLNIFSNSQFNYEKIIAPMSKGEYKFKIENTLDENIKYNIKLTEKNSFKVNMKYRLKLDNVYVVGTEEKWEDIQNLNLNNVIVTKNSANVYTLEWYWEEASNDTEIGKMLYADYKLNISIDSKVYIKE